MKNSNIKKYSDYRWIDDNLDPNFSSWDDEISYMNELGFELVSSNSYLPHWSSKDSFPTLFVYSKGGSRELNTSFDRPAGDLGYPVYFKKEKSYE